MDHFNNTQLPLDVMCVSLPTHTSTHFSEIRDKIRNQTRHPVVDAPQQLDVRSHGMYFSLK